MNPSRSPRAVAAALSAIATAALLLASASAHAVTVTDPAHDFLTTFGGSTASGDLDVLSASVTYDDSSDSFILSATMDGPIGETASGFYVWGVNTGSGTAAFAANGLPDILFDRVVILNSPTLGNFIPGSGALPSGAVTISGNTITAVVDEDLLPSTGFATSAYTWNLWPRDGSVPAGFAQISDFAPDTHDFGAVSAVPEPETYALMLAGLGIVGWSGLGRRRQRQR